MIQLLIAFLLLASPLQWQTSSPLDVMNQAAAAYASGDYQRAVVLYEGLIETGVHDPIVYFNLGNAYYQLADLGRATLNYRRTQVFLPRDADVNRNLERVIRERVDIQGDESGFWEGIAALTSGSLTLTELASLTALVWIIWCVIVAVAILNARWRPRLRFYLVGIGVVLLVGALLLGSRLWVGSQRPSAVVIQDTVQVMSGPGEEYLELYLLHAGADIRVWDRQNRWIKFAIPDGRMGWLPEANIGFVLP